MNDKFTISQFLNRFPNDKACLEEIKNLRWPSGLIPCKECEKATPHYKVTGRKSYACQWCGSHIYPLARTIFDQSPTPLRLWFYAIYIMAQTRAGISAKQLQRELGVTYKTAWRMFKQIRMLMNDTTGTPLTGTVEMDETFVGGKAKNRTKLWNPDTDMKEVVFGAVERGGKAYLKHVPNTGKWTLLKQIQEHVSPKARVITDEYKSYTQLPRFGYRHDWVNHRWEHVRGDIHTQNIENVWSHLKRGIRGVYRVVSRKYLQAYVDEYAFRYNNRKVGGKMFDLILTQVPNVKVLRV